MKVTGGRVHPERNEQFYVKHLVARNVDVEIRVFGEADDAEVQIVLWKDGQTALLYTIAHDGADLGGSLEELRAFGMEIEEVPVGGPPESLLSELEAGFEE